ncbi:MAG: FhaA domain-containing protein [Actinomycetota bacterium]
MGLLRRFEKSLEKAFEGPFARISRGRVHPLEIARRVLREMDEEKVLGVNEILAPNLFLVRLSPEDHHHLEAVLETLSREMEGLVIDYANRRDYHFAVRPRLCFMRDDSLGAGEFRVGASFEEGAAGPAAPSLAPTPRGMGGTGVLKVLSGVRAGSTLRLEGSRLSIGRSEENDLVLPDPRVSRFHAEIERAPQGYVLRDLGSTNGTLVNGRRVRERLLEDGDTISVAEVRMVFSVQE